MSVRRSLGYTYVYARKYEQARYHMDRAIAMNPTAEETYRLQGLILTFQNQFAAAERVLREALASGARGQAPTPRSRWPIRSRAQATARTLHRSPRSSREKRKADYVSPVELAMVYIALGDKEKALDAVESAIDDRRGWVAYLRVHPIVDPLRGEPRFAELLKG